MMLLSLRFSSASGRASEEVRKVMRLGLYKNKNVKMFVWQRLI
jgi:hypothetical protein